jgi:flagellar biosynthesis chaperone FliJ
MREKLLKRKEELQAEFDKLVQLLNETQTKLNQTSGAYNEIERQLKELDEPEVKNENQT